MIDNFVSHDSHDELKNNKDHTNEVKLIFFRTQLTRNIPKLL